MKQAQLTICASIIMAAVGCMQGEPGGPGVRTTPTGSQTQTANKPVIDDSRETFTVRTPAMSTTVKRGESKTVSLAISRGSEFKDEVQVSFSGIPAGVTLSPAMTTLNADDKELQVDISAATDAEVGDFSILVKGHPSSGGPDATNQLKFSVAAK